jgi:hypothetical protein
MLFLVDGYNVTRSDPSTHELSLEAQRDALVARLRARGAQMLGRGRIVVFFDAVDAAGAEQRDHAPIEVVYARSGTADDAIVRAAVARHEKVTLVSDDRELRDRVAVHTPAGFEALPASACFDAAGRGRSRKGRRPAVARETGLPRGANKITEELGRLWLGEDEQ